MKKVFALSILLLGIAKVLAADATYSVDVYPFVFKDIDKNDTAAQLDTWGKLMKYKLFATGDAAGNGIIFAGTKISIPEPVGYVGSAHGNFVMKNDHHVIGGPLLFGGTFKNESGSDTILTGPTRFKGKFETASGGSGANVFAGKYCFDGGKSDYTDWGISKGNGTVLTSTECLSTAEVYAVEDLKIPSLVDSVVTYRSAINADQKTEYIHVPPESPSDSGGFNVFYESISFANGGKLYVVMPPGGRLTKVFLKGRLSGLGSTTGTDIQVIHAPSNDLWDSTKSEWKTEGLVPVANSEYLGNLLFYTPEYLDIGAGQKNLQGTYMSGNSIRLAQNTNFAGQLLAAKSISVDAFFKATDFYFLPFNPVWIDIDPKASSLGTLYEGVDSLQRLTVNLSAPPTVDVTFSYCFVYKGQETSGKANGNTDASSADVEAVNGVPGALECNFKDTTSSGKKDSVPTNFYTAKFPKGSTTLESPIALKIKNDSYIENKETILIYLFDLRGAILSDKTKRGYFPVYIVDDDVAPVGKDLYVSGLEDTPVVLDSFPAYSSSENYSLVKYKVRIESLPEKGKLLYKGKPVAVKTTIAFPDTNLVFIADTNAFGSPFAKFTFRVLQSDGSNDYEAVTINTAYITIKPVNDAPILKDSVLHIPEDARKGTAADSVIKATDVENDTLKYTIVGGDSSIFAIDKSTGKVTLKKDVVLDREKDSVYTIVVVVDDGHGGKDTANVKIVVKDVAEVVKAITVWNGMQSWKIVNDTARINLSSANVLWNVSRDGVSILNDTTSYAGLKDSCYLKTYTYGKLNPVSDSVWVCVNLRTPIITVVPVNAILDTASGFTVEEGSDSSSYYLNKSSNDIVITIKDSDGSTKRDTIKSVTLDTTMTVPKDVLTAMGSIQDKFTFADPDSVVRTPENGKIAVTYTTTIDGKKVTVKYYVVETDSGSYEPVVDSSGHEVIYVGYETTINGKKVTVSYKADAMTGGKPIPSEGKEAFTVTYVASKDSLGNSLEVSFAVDKDGNMIYTESHDRQFTLIYNYVDSSGNKGSNTVQITLDTIVPVVQIVSPDSGETIYSVTVNVVWKVDGNEQDSLKVQSLQKGKNVIVRTYRDKAGNEATDSVIVFMKNGKNITVDVVKPVSTVNDSLKKELDLFYKDNPGAEEAKKKGYTISYVNPATGKQDDNPGTDNVYARDSALHFGPTLAINVKVPSVSETGGLASLDDMIEYGKVSLDPSKGKYAEYVSPEEYVEKYCDETFKAAYKSDGNKASIYTIIFKARVWVFTTLGQYVADYSFGDTLSNAADYVNEGGVVSMNFEMMPDEDGALRDPNGRLLGSGAYLFKTEITSNSKSHCCVDNNKDGTCEQPRSPKKVKESDDKLQSFGYRHPLLK